MPNCGAFGSGPMLTPRSSSEMFGKTFRPGNVMSGTGKLFDERRKAMRVSLMTFDVKLCSIVAENSRCLFGIAMKKFGRFAKASMPAPLVIVNRKWYCVAEDWLKSMLPTTWFCLKKFGAAKLTLPIGIVLPRTEIEPASLTGAGGRYCLKTA